MSIDKPSQSEDEYFAKQDAEARRKLAAEKNKATAQAERDRLKQLHWMHCPKCGFELETVTFKGYQIDKCYHCNGTWLDEGELQALAGKEPGFMQKVLSALGGK